MPGRALFRLFRCSIRRDPCRRCIARREPRVSKFHAAPFRFCQRAFIRWLMTPAANFATVAICVIRNFPTRPTGSPEGRRTSDRLRPHLRRTKTFAR